MPKTAGELADLLQAQCLGSSDREVSGVCTLGQIAPGKLTFYKDTKSLKGLESCEGATILVASSWAEQLADRSECSWILVEDPHSAFLELIPEFLEISSPRKVGISTEARIASSASIGAETQVHAGATIEEEVTVGERCEIHPGVVIGRGTTIGDDCLIYPNVVIYPGMEIRNRVILHANCVIGADGFGYHQKAGRHVKIPHYGNVVLEDDVEVGACSTIDRGFLDSTRIGTGSKIDNQVMVAHNCELGPHNILVSQVGFAGSITTGAYVVCAGQVGVADHVHLGEGAVFGAKAGIHKDMPGGETYLGAPAIPEAEAIRQVMAARKLPEMRSQLKKMEKQLQTLQKQLDNDESQTPAA
ncbi:MAG: UDP-3-O-(3-hydroxymyristoyl)glucosamine N-acyltransferase [Planctomycetaceae bacterium]|nr:UDP-3-O-(3-hydroxymyristoyl)glucosamine N-acyltransferase [Planctomycetaceae bacterium]